MQLQCTFIISCINWSLPIPPQVQEMEQTLPPTCRVQFSDPHKLYNLQLIVSPDEGYWAGGQFLFDIVVTEEYNMVVSF